VCRVASLRKGGIERWWLSGKRFFFFLKSDCGLDTHLYREIFDRCKLKENTRIPNIMTIEKFI